VQARRADLLATTTIAQCSFQGAWRRELGKRTDGRRKPEPASRSKRLCNCKEKKGKRKEETKERKVPLSKFEGKNFRDYEYRGQRKDVTPRAADQKHRKVSRRKK